MGMVPNGRWQEPAIGKGSLRPLIGGSEYIHVYPETSEKYRSRGSVTRWGQRSAEEVCRISSRVPWKEHQGGCQTGTVSDFDAAAYYPCHLEPVEKMNFRLCFSNP